jgi:CP family cyanate transporter-like MFS transporter
VTPRRRSARALATLFLVGLALRPQIVGVGPLLPRIQSALGISHGVAGLLSTIPVLCMGLFAPLAPALLRRYGSRAAVGVSVITVGVFGIVRAGLPDAALVLALTVPVGIGIAGAGTLLPVVVREEYPLRPALGTSVYAAGINVGATVASLAAVPLAVVIGWRGALVVYSAATLAFVLPWLGRPHPEAHSVERAPLPWRVRIAWGLVGTFALQSILFYGFNAWLADAYVDRGWSQAAAGGLVAVMNALALAVGIGAGALGDRVGSRRRFLVAGSVLALAAASLMAANVPSAWVWTVALGASSGLLFTTAMTLPLDTAHGRGEVAAMSTLMLGVGYVIAALAPVVLGAVRDATGSFTLPLALLAADALALLCLTATISTRRLAAAYTRSIPV